MEQPYTEALAPNGPPLPDLAWICIFENLSPGTLLGIRCVSRDWKRLAEAAALTRNELYLLHSSVRPNGTSSDARNLITLPSHNYPYDVHRINSDGTSYQTKNLIQKQIDANSISCRSFTLENAQCLVDKFPNVSSVLISQYVVSVVALEPIRYILSQWAPNVRALQFYCRSIILKQEALNGELPLSQTIIDAHLAQIFAQLKTMPRLNRLTMAYRRGQIKATLEDYAFLPGLTELHLIRHDLEDNLEAACRKHLALKPQGPPSKLRRFTNICGHPTNVEAVRQFVRFMETEDAGLALANANTHHYCGTHSMQEARQLTRRYPSLRVFQMHHTLLSAQLAQLTRDLSINLPYLQILSIGIHCPVAQPSTELVPPLVPLTSVRALEVHLYSADHTHLHSILEQTKAAFPNLYSIRLIEHRRHCRHCPIRPFAEEFPRCRTMQRLGTKLLTHLAPAEPSTRQLINCHVHVVATTRRLFLGRLIHMKFKHVRDIVFGR